MKQRLIITIAALVIAGFGVGPHQAFAAKGYGNALKSSKSLEATKEKIEVALKELDKTMKPLKELVFEEGDLRKNYEKFSGELKDLATLAEGIRARTTEMHAKGFDYFEKWGEEASAIQSDVIRQRSEERRQKLLARYENIQTIMQNTRDVFAPFIANLKDIDVYLSTDLNAESVASIADLIEQASADEMVVREKGTIVLNELQAVAEAINPKGGKTKK